MTKRRVNITKDVLWDESVFQSLVEGIDNSKIIEHYYELEKEDPKGKRNSNDGGWQKFLEPNRCKELDRLLESLQEVATDIWNKGYDRKETLTISNAWFNGNNFGDNNIIHTHPGATMSGVYYLTEGKSEHGMIHFVRPNMREVTSFRKPSEEEQFRINEPGKESAEMCYTRTVSYPAKESLALIFAPWIPHYVTSNRTEELRIVIGLNFTILGKENMSHLDASFSDDEDDDRY
jgi:uncharacterized protein (TIGR02466 family)